MNHDDATRLFDGLGETVASHPATADLLSAGRAAERGQRRRTIAGAAAAVALILGGGAVVHQATAGQNDAPTPNQVAELPPAPDGMHLVGMKRVAVAVPDSWGFQDTMCGQPVAATVYFTETFVRACLVNLPEPVPTLHFVGAETDEGRDIVSSAGDAGTRAGLTVFEHRYCKGIGVQCPVPLPYVVALPAQGVVMVLGGPASEEPLRSQILDTLQLLPDEYVAVPRIEPGTLLGIAQRTVRAAGLDDFANAPDVEVRTFGTDPEAGLVVARGSRVTMLLQPRNDLTVVQAGAALRVVNTYLDKNPDWDVRVATATSETGTVDQPNTGKQCQSGELLQITLIGTFPGVLTSGGPPGGDGTNGKVTRMLLTADAKTEEVCLVGVGTGPSQPDPDATVVYESSDPSPEPPQSLICPTEQRGVASAPYFNESAPGAPTPEQAVEAWLGSPMGARFGSDYVMDEDRTHAWILRADGTAQARVNVKLTAGGGYFYYGHEACG